MDETVTDTDQRRARTEADETPHEREQRLATRSDRVRERRQEARANETTDEREQKLSQLTTNSLRLTPHNASAFP